MSSSPWQVEGHVARLRTAELQAVVDLRNPGAGLRIEQVAGAAALADCAGQWHPSAASLFQLPLNGGGVQLDPASLDFFVRGGDLVAVYAETPARPVRAEVYWRFVAAGADPERATGQVESAAIELIVSMQTSRLDSDPSLTVGTSLSADWEAWRLSDPDSGQFAECSADGKREWVFEPDAGPGCFLFRGKSPVSYLEMVHPADFRLSKLDSPAATASGWRLEHRLFSAAAGGLEKGVILRSRLRGLFISRQHDLFTAAAEYRRFADSEPPLTV